MANKVGLKEAEYDVLLTEIKNGHEASLAELEAAVTKLETLNTKSGGLYAEQLTPNISAMIAEIRAICRNMESTYQAHEQMIESFRTAIGNYDTN